jgi:hypothetical protein
MSDAFYNGKNINLPLCHGRTNQSILLFFMCNLVECRVALLCISTNSSRS